MPCIYAYGCDQRKRKRRKKMVHSLDRTPDYQIARLAFYPLGYQGYSGRDYVVITV